MRKKLSYTIPPLYLCTCGARYDHAVDKCEITIGTDHVIYHVENRDEGKLYVIEELAARPARYWAVKAFSALLNAGVKVPDEIAQAGMAGLSIVFQNPLLLFNSISNVQSDAVNALLDELLTCVKIVRDKRHPEMAFDMVAEDDIEEVTTQFTLAREVFKLHINFSKAAIPSSLTQSRTAA